ncbi:MAG: hypothetical protein AVDCRST_MAG66-4354, partial [uncultured Pseudonocardia sp.]
DPGCAQRPDRRAGRPRVAPRPGRPAVRRRAVAAARLAGRRR